MSRLHSRCHPDESRRRLLPMRKTTAARNADALAERQEQIRALTEKLESGVKAVFESEDYAKYLEAMSKFHHYSFGNCLLIFFQCPEASAVAGYTTWKKLGRTVKKRRKRHPDSCPLSAKASCGEGQARRAGKHRDRPRWAAGERKCRY